MNEVEKTMNDFAHRVVHDAKLNLFPGALKNSIRADLDVFPNSFSLEFFMNAYGLFQDKGVDGTQVRHGGKWRYKSVRWPSKKFAKSMEDWARKHNVRVLRDKDGKFKKGSFKQMGYMMAWAKQRKGTKPSLFFTRPFEAAFADLPDDVVKAYGLELDKTFKQWLEKPNLEL